MKKSTQPSNMFRLAKSRFNGAFSLVELLVVIAVIGLIAAIAIPNIANLTDAAGTGAAKRNAQNIVSTYSAAVAAGWTPNAAGEDACVAEITDTAPITAGGGSFHVPGMDPGDVTKAKDYMAFENNMLVYKSAGD